MQKNTRAMFAIESEVLDVCFQGYRNARITQRVIRRVVSLAFISDNFTATRKVFWYTTFTPLCYEETDSNN